MKRDINLAEMQKTVDSASKAMITLYQIASSPLRKVSWIGLLFPFKSGCGGVICAKPRRTDL